MVGVFGTLWLHDIAQDSTALYSIMRHSIVLYLCTTLIHCLAGSRAPQRQWATESVQQAVQHAVDQGAASCLPILAALGSSYARAVDAMFRICQQAHSTAGAACVSTTGS